MCHHFLHVVALSLCLYFILSTHCSPRVCTPSQGCSSLFSVAVINIMTKSKLRKGGFISASAYASISRSIFEESQVGIPSRSLESGTMEESLMAPAQPAFLSSPGPPVQGMVPPTVGGALPHQSTSKTMPPPLQTWLQAHQIRDL